MNNDVNKLFIVHLNEHFDLELYNKLSLLISPYKKAQLDSLKSSADKKIRLYAEILVRIAIHQDLAMKNSSISLATNKYGKLYLANNDSYHFSISHTRNMIAVAVSNEPVGVDVEMIRSDNLKIAKRFFTENEIAYIEENPSGIFERFFEIWTKKEAYLKFLGTGLNTSLKSFSVFDNEHKDHYYTIMYGKYVINTYFSKPNLCPPVIVHSENALQDLSKEL